MVTKCDLPSVHVCMYQPPGLLVMYERTSWQGNSGGEDSREQERGSKGGHGMLLGYINDLNLKPEFQEGCV